MTKDQETRAEAWVKDTCVYADLDEKTGLYCVFGNNSGFAYANSLDKEKAEAYAAELNQNKTRARLYE